MTFTSLYAFLWRYWDEIAILIGAMAPAILKYFIVAMQMFPWQPNSNFDPT
jgi:hypothetical protein